MDSQQQVFDNEVDQDLQLAIALSLSQELSPSLGTNVEGAVLEGKTFFEDIFDQLNNYKNRQMF